ncbi:hypothetical protein [Actinoplanes sp. NPDC049802]|uniref:hypothetical protein n=1 Tax=Actinoplanes sp. NPDC049802 TaxID=3154742 RepID=UPI0033F4EFFF
MKKDGGPLGIAWLFLTVALALSSGVAQLVVSGWGRLALGAIFVISLTLLILRFARRRIGAGLIGALHERDRLRDGLNYVLDSADSPFSEKIDLTVRVGDSGSGDKVRHEAVTSPRKPLRYRAFYPVVPDARNPPGFESMEFSGAVLSPRSAGIEILPIRKDRWIRVVALFRPAVEKPCHWVVEYRSPGLWDPLRESGWDTLTWRMRHDPGADDESVAELTINFVAPAGSCISVSERGKRGSIESFSGSMGSQYSIWRIPEARPGDVFVFDLQLAAQR